MEISRSDIVRSLAGHDRGQLFFVMKVEGSSVWIADGDRRRAERPKRKNCKHVCHVARIDSRVAGMLRQGDKVLNSELRKELASFRRLGMQGGGPQDACGAVPARPHKVI